MSDDQPPRRPSRRRLLKIATAAGAGGLAGAAGVNALAPAVLPEERVFETNRSYWSRALPPATAPLAADLDADVVVIGGGFTGLSAAYYLRRNLPGKRIVLLEAKACGNGASGRNGAMVLTLTEDRYMVASRDPAIDRRLYALTVDNIHRLRALSQAVGIDCELEQNGALQVINSADAVSERRAYARKARDQGFPFAFWTRDQTAAAIGARVYEGALIDPNSGQVHPGKLVGVWKAAATGAGAEIYDGTPVIHIEEGPVHRLTTAGGYVVRAPILVLATNAYTSRLGYLRGAVAPVFDYVGITPPLDEAQLAAAGWKARMPFNDSRTQVCYAGLTRDGRIHFGGGLVDYAFNNGLRAPANTPQRYEGMHREFARVFPALADVPFETAWSGSVDMTLDGAPAVGQMGRHRNIFYGIGFSGHGVNMTSVFGRVIADLVSGGREQWAWLPFLDHLPPYIPNEPFRWLGVESVLATTGG